MVKAFTNSVMVRGLCRRWSVRGFKGTMSSPMTRDLSVTSSCGLKPGINSVARLMFLPARMSLLRDGEIGSSRGRLSADTPADHDLIRLATPGGTGLQAGGAPKPLHCGKGTPDTAVAVGPAWNWPEAPWYGLLIAGVPSVAVLEPPGKPDRFPALLWAGGRRQGIPALVCACALWRKPSGAGAGALVRLYGIPSATGSCVSSVVAAPGARGGGLDGMPAMDGMGDRAATRAATVASRPVIFSAISSVREVVLLACASNVVLRDVTGWGPSLSSVLPAPSCVPWSAMARRSSAISPDFLSHESASMPWLSFSSRRRRVTVQVDRELWPAVAVLVTRCGRRREDRLGGMANW